MQETCVQSLGWENSLENGMATHPSILAWRIPWTEEPGGLQSLGGKELDTTEQLHFHFQQSIVYMHHTFFVHSSVDGHLDCFHTLATVSIVSMNNGGGQTSFWISACF